MAISAEEFKEKAAARRRAKTKDVTIPDIGVVRLRSLSAGDAIAFQGEVKRAKAAGQDENELTFPFIARSWIGDDGEPLFPEADGIAFAKTLDPETFAELAKEALKLNGLDDKAVDDAAKNSGASPDASTPSGSRENTAGSTST